VRLRVGLFLDQTVRLRHQQGWTLRTR
jgi:hypothetical protein